MEQQDFLIAGGGIAGLGAALGLARIGQPVRLFEQAATFEEVGAGLQMSPNGVSALQWLGAWDHVEKACVAPAEIHVRDGRSGRFLQRVKLGRDFEKRFGAPYRVCHRADLLAGLVAAASGRDGVRLETGRRIETCETAGAATCVNFAGSVEQAWGRAVIVADGINSTLRRQMVPEAEAVFRGHTLYRALLPVGEVPAETAVDCVSLWLHPGGHVVHYPVTGGRAFNMVAAVNDRAWTADRHRQSDGAPLRKVFSTACDQLRTLLDRPPHWLAWPGADLAELPRWHTGHTVLIGDAAHASLPYLAQGAVMALEDACVLAAELSRGDNLADAFAAYALARRPRTARVQNQSRKLAGYYHADGLTAFARNGLLSLLRAESFIGRNAWLYAWRPPVLGT